MWVTTTTIKDSRQLLVSKSRLKFIVKTHSFKGGKLKLRCLANIHNVYSQAIELDIEEEKPRLNSDATQVVILPSNFLEKKSEAETQNRNHNEFAYSRGVSLNQGLLLILELLVSFCLLLLMR
ncbi:hypothetical protein RUM43_009760 [Polyplax serrata]|uniref:Uncharacterized protein n=1 Tax=Polyplax serrata TaxID=468196 RepID=A0AAN8NZF6_POLSC